MHKASLRRLFSYFDFWMFGILKYAYGHDEFL